MAVLPGAKLGVMANSAHFCNRRLQSCPAFLSSCRASLSAKQKTLSSIQVGPRKGECDESALKSLGVQGGIDQPQTGDFILKVVQQPGPKKAADQIGPAVTRTRPQLRFAGIRLPT